jgi:hypothetical protein
VRALSRRLRAQLEVLAVDSGPSLFIQKHGEETMKSLLAFAGAAAIVLCGIGRADAVVITSNFSAGTDGWTSSGSNLAQVPAGGNPGGFLQSTDASSSVATLFAPAPFLGDLSTFDGGSLSLDTILVFNNGGAPYVPFGTVTIANGGLSASLDLVAGPTPLVWSTFGAALTSAAWGVSASDWATILSNETSISFIIESTFGQGERVGLDNFTLTSSNVDPVIPEPSSIVLLLLGTSGAAGFGYFRRRKSNIA